MHCCHRMLARRQIRTNHRARLVTNSASPPPVPPLTIEASQPCCVGQTTVAFPQRRFCSPVHYGRPRRCVLDLGFGVPSILHRNPNGTNPHCAGLPLFTRRTRHRFAHCNVWLKRPEDLLQRGRRSRIIGRVRKMDKVYLARIIHLT